VATEKEKGVDKVIAGKEVSGHTLTAFELNVCVRAGCICACSLLDWSWCVTCACDMWFHAGAMSLCAVMVGGACL